MSGAEMDEELAQLAWDSRFPISARGGRTARAAGSAACPFKGF